MSRIIVTGSSGGLGAAIVSELERATDGSNINALHSVYGFDLPHHDVCGVTPEHFARATDGAPIDVLINCAGINQQDWMPDMTEADFDHVMDVNAKGIWKMTQAALAQLIASRGTVLNITSNAAWMPMTCSLAYNASKAAAHMITLQMARELTKKYGITVFGIAPNKLKGTGMSRDIEQEVLRTRGWTAEFAQEYQLKALLTGEETEPKVLAEFIAYLLRSKRNHSQLSGCIIPYGA